MDELQARVDEIKNAPGTGVEPLPEVKPYETFNYAAVDQRSPFEPGISALANAPNAIRPDQNRPREFLEQFSLDTLRMVGTVKLKVSCSAWFRPRTDWCTGCCLATIWDRAMAESQPSRKPRSRSPRSFLTAWVALLSAPLRLR